MADAKMVEKIKYETIRDLKGFTEKYKRDDWSLEEKCFSSYLSVLDKMIKETMAKEGGERYTGDALKQYIDMLTESKIREFDERVREARNSKTALLVLNKLK